MSRRSDRHRLQHMLDHAREAVDLARGKTRADLERERVLSLALVRLLEIVGEAAARVSPGLQRRHENVPWPEIVGLRNRLIHGYDAVDMEILWQIVTQDLPSLVAQVEAIIQNLPDSS